MPQTLTDALAREVFSRLPPDRSHGPAEFDSLPLLLARALRQRLADEVDARLDAVAPWVGDESDRWVSAARAQARFPAEAWREAVPAEVERIVATLVAPSREMATWAIPDGEAPVDDVLDRMRQFGAYPYLTEIVGRYAEKKGLDTVAAEAFGQLLARIDRRLAAELDVDGWMALLAPLYDLTEAVPELDRALSGLVLGEVFSARGLPGVGARLVEEEGLDRAELRAALREILNADADDVVLEAALRSGALDEDDESSGEGAPTPGDEADAPEPADPDEPTDESLEEDLADGSQDAPEAESPSRADLDNTPEADHDTATDGGDAEEEPETEEMPEATDEVLETDEPLAEAAEAEAAEAEDAERDALAEATGAADASGEDEAEHQTSKVPVDSDPVLPPNPFDGIDASPAPSDTHKTQPLPGLSDLLGSEPAATPPDEAASEVEAPEAHSKEVVVPTSADPAAEAGTEAAPEPLWARLARERREAAGEPGSPKPEASGTPLWKQFASGGAAPDAPAATLAESIFESDAPQPTVRDTIADAPPEEVRPEDYEALVLGEAADNGPWYIESLFSGDADAYARVLALLAVAPSWTDATQIIGREVFRRYRVNIYSEPAISFTGAVEARYQRQ